MAMKSHTPEEIREAMKRGETVWVLDTQTSGNDDILIGNDRDNLVADILLYHDLEEFPAEWTLPEIPADEIKNYLPTKMNCYDCTSCSVVRRGDGDYTLLNSHGEVIATSPTLMGCRMEQTGCHTRFMQPREV